jgi:hypothetical protein
LKTANNWQDWMLIKNQHYKIQNQVVYSDCVPLANHSNIVIDLKDIVKSGGAALLQALDLPVVAQHQALVDHWLSLHSLEIVAQLT